MRFKSVRFFFYLQAFLLFLFFIYFSLRYVKIASEKLFYNDIKNVEIGNKKNVIKVDEKTKSTSELKYILQWTSSKNVPFVYMGKGQQGFIDRNCTYTNCFVTSNRLYLGDIQKFDVIAFSAPEVVRYAKDNLPKTRSPHQKYAFASIESSHNYPLCSDHLNDFFNWTWTFKTNSDARWGYLAIRDSDGTLIGPNSIMHWLKLEDMKPISPELKEKLKSKKKAVAWFVSNCYTKSKREIFVKDLQNELKIYNLNVDVYGTCGPLKCSTTDHNRCLKILEKDYYFYLSLENSFTEDYVTEKLLHALLHNTIPIVYGAANYTRFMPDGIYLNARELGAQRLAEKIRELILNPDKYAEYFRWQNHYSYHERYEDMKSWWNPPNQC